MDKIKRVFKDELNFDGLAIMMPKFATILKVANQGDDICIWAEVVDENDLEPRYFEVFGTGHAIRQEGPRKREYLDTVLTSSFVWHIYEIIN